MPGVGQGPQLENPKKPFFQTQISKTPQGAGQQCELPGIALALTFPTWITVNYLGDPDNGTILAGYVGSFLMAGGFLAIGSCISAVTKNQVIAFVISVSVCLLFLLIGWPPVIDVTKLPAF